jgi:hypothetical protein
MAVPKKKKDTTREGPRIDVDTLVAVCRAKPVWVLDCFVEALRIDVLEARAKPTDVRFGVARAVKSARHALKTKSPKLLKTPYGADVSPEFGGAVRLTEKGRETIDVPRHGNWTAKGPDVATEITRAMVRTGRPAQLRKLCDAWARALFARDRGGRGRTR